MKRVARSLIRLVPLILLSLTFFSCSDLLNQLSGKNDPPAAPSSLIANINTNGDVVLNWLDRSDNEDGFKIEEQKLGDFAWNEIASVGQNVTSFTWMDSEENTTYLFRVYAFNENDNSGEVVSNSVVVPFSSPTDLTSQINGTTIMLNWQDHSGIEQGYKVFRSAGGANAEEIASLPPNSTSYSDDAFPSGATLTYHVSAFTGTTLSDPSNDSQIIAPVLETTVVTETFESYTAGRLLDAPWDVASTDASVTAFVIANSNMAPQGGLKNLAFYDDNHAEEAYADLAFTSVDQGTVEFDLYIEPDDVNHDYNFGVFLSVDQVWLSDSDIGPMFLFDTSGSMFAADGDNYQDAWTFPTGQWSHIVIDFDTDASSYSVSVDGNVLMSNLGYHLNKTGSGVVAFSLYMFNDSRLWLAQLDNLTVTDKTGSTVHIQGVRRNGEMNKSLAKSALLSR